MIKVAPGPVPQAAARERLCKVYDRLWSDALPKIRQGKVELDPALKTGRPDQRRGLTLIARPSLLVRRQVATLLAKLRRFEPEQYYYTAAELHVTILSLFTATAEYEPFFSEKERYAFAVDKALAKFEPVRIDFEGVTASPGTVMIQGFFETAKLNKLRDALRRELAESGLGRGVDERYRLETAHMTALRFRVPLRNPKRVSIVLEQARQKRFGSTTFRCLSLVENDWYMSHHTTRTVKRYVY